MIDMLGQSSVHSVVFHEEVCVDTCVLEIENYKKLFRRSAFSVQTVLILCYNNFYCFFKLF